MVRFAPQNGDIQLARKTGGRITGSTGAVRRSELEVFSLDPERCRRGLGWWDSYDSDCVGMTYVRECNLPDGTGFKLMTTI